jgi:hypothetical protein
MEGDCEMFVRPVVLILGAGANKEFGMPLGLELMASITKAINPKDEPDYHLREYVRRRAKNDNQEYINAGIALTKVMPLFVSIDEALHYYSEQEHVVTLGKIAIAHQILRAERNCKLFRKTDPHRANLSGVDDTWIAHFLSMAAGAQTMAQMDRVFSPVTIIDFNYDRCMEFYLYWALQERLNLPPEHAREIVNKLAIFRPHGSIGSLAGDGDGVLFGLLAVASG